MEGEKILSIDGSCCEAKRENYIDRVSEIFCQKQG
jgi:hypothetical protein